MTAAAPELGTLCNAVRFGVDWRPLAGFRPEDSGSWLERVAGDVVINESVRAHNKANS
jgi:hypothetical protein